MVPRSNEDRDAHLAKRAPYKLHGVRCEVLLLLEVAGAQQGVGSNLGRKLRDVLQSVSQCLPTQYRYVPSEANEGSVEMQVREQDKLQPRLLGDNVILLK